MPTIDWKALGKQLLTAVATAALVVLAHYFGIPVQTPAVQVQVADPAGVVVAKTTLK